MSSSRFESSKPRSSTISRIGRPVLTDSLATSAVGAYPLQLTQRIAFGPEVHGAYLFLH
jgi:hypothetical protein